MTAADGALASLLAECRCSLPVPSVDSHQSGTIKLFTSLASAATPSRDHDTSTGLSLDATAAWLALYGVATDQVRRLPPCGHVDKAAAITGYECLRHLRPPDHHNCHHHNPTTITATTTTSTAPPPQATATELCNGRLDRDTTIAKLIETAGLVRAARRLDNLDLGPVDGGADASASSSVADGLREEADVWSTIPAMTDLVLRHRRELFATEFPLFPPEVASVLPTLASLDDDSVLMERTYLERRVAELEDALAAETEMPAEAHDHELHAPNTPDTSSRVVAEEDGGGGGARTQEALTTIRVGTRRLTDALDSFDKLHSVAVDMGALPGDIRSEEGASGRGGGSDAGEVNVGLGLAASQICERADALQKLDEQSEQAAGLADQILYVRSPLPPPPLPPLPPLRPPSLPSRHSWQLTAADSTSPVSTLGSCIDTAGQAHADRARITPYLASLERALDVTSKKHATLKRRCVQVEGRERRELHTHNKGNVAAR